MTISNAIINKLNHISIIY